MTDTKISELTELAGAPGTADELMINDGGTSKRISVAHLGGAFARSRKTADTDKTCCVTYSCVCGMSFTPLINKNYQIIMQVRMTGSTTFDGNTSFSVPTGAQSRTIRAGFNLNNPATERLTTDGQKTNTSLVNGNIFLSTILNMGSTAGDVSLQFRQDTSGCVTSTIFANSTMLVWQLD